MTDYFAALYARVSAHDAREAEKREEAAAAKAKALEDARRYMWEAACAVDRQG